MVKFVRVVWLVGRSSERNPIHESANSVSFKCEQPLWDMVTLIRGRDASRRLCGLPSIVAGPFDVSRSCCHPSSHSGHGSVQLCAIRPHRIPEKWQLLWWTYYGSSQISFKLWKIIHFNPWSWVTKKFYFIHSIERTKAILFLPVVQLWFEDLEG